MIRNAIVSDAKAIHEMTLKLSVKSDSNSPTGFVDFPTRSIKEYEKLITSTKYFLVLEVQHQIIGFLAAYPSETLNDRYWYDDKIINHIDDDMPYLYAEQIGIIPEFRGNKLSEKLQEHLISTLNGHKSIWLAISHRPIKNLYSIKAVKRNGFKLIKEINEYGIVFGLYQYKK